MGFHKYKISSIYSGCKKDLASNKKNKEKNLTTT